MIHFVLFGLTIFGLLLSTSFLSVFAGGTDLVENDYFSINVPDSWPYTESFSPTSNNIIAGPVNSVQLTPSEFSDFLLTTQDKFREKIQDGGVYSFFRLDPDYRIKNSPLESYVKYQIDGYGIMDIVTQQYTTVGKEKAVRIYTNETATYGNTNIVLYIVMHDNEPYYIGYLADVKNYEKYLPEFEKMVKSFRFVGNPSSEIEDLSENENKTNRTTNFSGANLTELNTNRTGDSNYPEELYDECVNVAGKSFCDFLFKR